MSNRYAPVAMFVYNRLDNVKRTMDCLAANTLAKQTDLFVFSDGGRDERSWAEVNAVRQYFKTLPPLMKSITLVERPENFYLERNILSGIDQVLSMQQASNLPAAYTPRVIVLEDDICTAPHFLQYMNDALTHYEAEKRVMHISGFTNLDIPHKGDVYFTSHMSGWGWATWGDRWQAHFRAFTSREEALQQLTDEQTDHIQYGGNFRCLHHLDRNPIPWDICWEIAIYANDGLCLTPTQTLVRNIGIASGTHFRSQALFGHYDYDRPFTLRRLNVAAPVAPDHEVETVLNPAALKDHGFRYNLLGRIVRYFYLRIRPKR